MKKNCKSGYYYCFTDKKCKKIPRGYHVMGSGRLMKDSDHDDEGKKNGSNGGNGHSNGGNGNGSGNGGSNGNGGGVSEGYTSADNAERIKRYDGEKKRFAKADARMKYGKFADKVKEAQGRLRKGEVKKLVNGKWVSNKD